jgi:alcohol dehydrogenase class IV
MNLANTEVAPIVIKYLEEHKNKVADIRNKLNIKVEIENEVRHGIIQLLDEMIQRLKTDKETEKKGDDNWE